MNLDNILKGLSEDAKNNREYNQYLYTWAFLMLPVLPYIGIGTDDNKILEFNMTGDMKFTVPETVGDDIYISVVSLKRDEGSQYINDFSIATIPDEDTKITCKDDLITLVKFIGNQILKVALYAVDESYLDRDQEDLDSIVNISTLLLGSSIRTRYLCRVRKGEYFDKARRNEFIKAYEDSTRTYIDKYIEKNNRTLDEKENPYEEV